jgi:hypothetical protein
MTAPLIQLLAGEQKAVAGTTSQATATHILVKQAAAKRLSSRGDAA